MEDNKKEKLRSTIWTLMSHEQKMESLMKRISERVKPALED